MPSKRIVQNQQQQQQQQPTQPDAQQKQALLIRQLEDELRLAHETRVTRTTDADVQQHIDALCLEKENLFKENCLLRDTIRELELRIETQKQTLSVRDESIRKMVEMMNNKGIATKLMEDERVEVDRVKTRNIELEARLRHYETIIQNKEKELIKVSCWRPLVVRHGEIYYVRLFIVLSFNAQVVFLLTFSLFKSTKFKFPPPPQIYHFCQTHISHANKPVPLFCRPPKGRRPRCKRAKRTARRATGR